MAQYQSFPDAPGDSRTLAKLTALHLPLLKGRRFLDVGCNEGYFCGFAQFEGATHVVGVDHSAAFISRARLRYPGCEFLHRTWDQLPQGPFDVILLASALHYADDQHALIGALVERLSADGVLVLELGIAPSPRSEWVRVKRGIDHRLFPSMTKLREILEQYAWKWIGPSVRQDGDPVPRHVVHVSHMRPLAYLLMQPPAYGKSTIARRLFVGAGLPVVSGDEVIRRIVTGQQSTAGDLQTLLATDYSPFRLDNSIRRAFDAGHGDELVNAWLDGAPQGDLAIDAYVPESRHEQVRSALANAGYLPVTLNWERVAMPLPSEAATAERAEAYQAALSALARHGDEVGPLPVFPGRGLGFVDDVELRAGCLRVRGWAIGEDGRPSSMFSVGLAGHAWLTPAEHVARPDVVKRLGLEDERCGFVICLNVGQEASETLSELEVRAGNGPDDLGPPLRMARQLSARGDRGAGMSRRDE
jgi:SAM-dependent methyltransferase